MNTILNKLIVPPHMEDLAVDREFNILETSRGVQRFADSPNEVIKGRDVRLSFPELIGVEDKLIAVLEE